MALYAWGNEAFHLPGVLPSSVSNMCHNCKNYQSFEGNTDFRERDGEIISEVNLSSFFFYTNERTNKRSCCLLLFLHSWIRWYQFFSATSIIFTFRHHAIDPHWKIYVKVYFFLDSFISTLSPHWTISTCMLAVSPLSIETWHEESCSSKHAPLYSTSVWSCLLWDCVSDQLVWSVWAISVHVLLVWWVLVDLCVGIV